MLKDTSGVKIMAKAMLNMVKLNIFYPDMWEGGVGVHDITVFKEIYLSISGK